MKILYDGYIYQLQSGGGINRYFASIIGRLPANFEPVLLTTQTRALSFPDHPRLCLKQHRRFAFRPGRLAYAIEKVLFNRDARASRPDVIHPSYHHTLLRTDLRKFKTPVVSTIYDCIYEHFGQTFDPDGTERAAKKALIEQSDLVLTISESSKRDILEFYDLIEEKIVVHPLGSDLPVPRDSAPENEVPYFLFVGNRWEYKNFSLAVQALKILRQKFPDIRLRLVGPPFARGEVGVGDAWVEHMGAVDDQTLASLYSGSLALVFPSRYEGFGLPVLEAMCCKTAVIASNCSSLPELVGTAGILVEPDSLDALVAAMETILTNSPLREQLVLRGVEQAKKFCWEDAVTAIIGAYRTVTQ